MDLAEKLKERLIARIDVSRDISDDEVNEIIVAMIQEEYNTASLSLKEKLRVRKELFHSVRGLDVLEDLFEDAEISEIMINGYDRIFIEKRGRLFRYDGAFSSEEKLANVIQMMAAKANKRVNEASPIADIRLSDGSRVNVVLSPVSLHGAAVTIRRFPAHVMTMEDFITLGSISKEAAAFLQRAVLQGYNIFISGGTGSGKTTFLNALAGFLPKEERIITIEDSAELRLTESDNVVSLECRSANTEGEGEITIRDLIRTALRMRPTRIIVGEVRGPEALDMLQAMNTGHDGSLSTGHANSPADMLTRLETMVLMGSEMPLSAVRAQIASAIDLMVHVGRFRDGSRKVVEISEIVGMADGAICLSPLFLYKKEAAGGSLCATGNQLHRKKGVLQHA